MYCRSFTTLLFSLSFASAFLALVQGSPVVKDHNSLIRLHIAKLLNTTSTGKILARDQARIYNFRHRTNASSALDMISARQSDEQEQGTALATDQVVDYVVSVEVGTPPTQYQLLVDTGSANTWVGAAQRYNHTTSSIPTNQFISVRYGSGMFSGTQYNDAVSLGTGLTVMEQGIGVANTSSGFQGVDGILGIGPAGLTIGTLSPNAAESVPTVTDNLFTGGNISQRLVAISFEPNDTIGIINGELAFGGLDSSRYVGNVTYAPAASSSAALDTGTTFTLIPSDAFAIYQNATGAVMDNSTNMLSILVDEYDKLQSLFFTIGETVFEFPPNAQIWPRALNTAIGGTTDKLYLIIGDGGVFTPTGINFVNGMTFLERFYAVFNSTDNTIGLANTAYTNSTIN
ncbi:aspartic proteinase from Irpex Lacteus [Cubamyces lactineus]|nr:aspartic proteinase from Irpex Lacteus [Cubamyces lactineus]